MERTFAAIFASEGISTHRGIKSQLEREGFTIVAEESVSGEELREVGIDLGLAVGEEGRKYNAGNTLLHSALVLERMDAVKSMIAISKE